MPAKVFPGRHTRLEARARRRAWKIAPANRQHAFYSPGTLGVSFHAGRTRHASRYACTFGKSR